MKKTWLALSLATVFTGTACAQSNVTIYGVLDTGYIKETGSDLQKNRLCPILTTETVINTEILE